MSRKKLIVLFGFLSLLILVIKLLFPSEITKIDTCFYSFILNYLRSDSLTFIMKIITKFGNPTVLIAIVVIFYIFRQKKVALIMSANLGLVFLLNQILKFIIQRERPNNFALIEEIGYSFPSAHAMVSTAFYGLIIYIINKAKLNNKSKKIITFSIVVMIPILGFSRVYLGVHYLSDIIAGYIFALFFLFIFLLHLEKSNKKIWKKM